MYDKRAKQDALDLWFSMPGEMSVDDFAAELEQKNDPQDQATLMTHQKKLEWCEAQLAHVGQAA